MTTTINTARVSERRLLHFNTLDDIAADVDRLAGARDIRALGNWSAGQVFNHLATVMNKSIDGFAHRPPALIRFVIRLLFKRRMLARTMPAGFKLPTKAAAELVSPPISLEDGLAQIRKGFERLRRESQRAPHPVLGTLIREEWDQLHCRHSELHLSFLQAVE
jgi:hypothetical protein